MDGDERAGAAPRAHWWMFWAIVAVAAALRLAVAFTTGAVHPDEIFQYLEQAHRAAFGYGIVPWEYRYGMRSWLLPGALAGSMELGELVAPGTDLYLILPKALVALVSLLVLPAAYALGARLSRLHGFVALAVTAIWYETVYYGAHVLTEPLAVALILPAAALLMQDAQSRARLVLAGFLLGLATILRFHYVPAIAVLGLMTCAGDWRGRLVPAVAGGLAAFALSAIVDLASGLAPFSWIVTNFNQNVVVNRSADFGVSPALEYLAALTHAWGLAFLPILLLLLPVFARYRALIVMAVVNIAVHSLIGHKEYRFIFLSVTIVVIVAAIGSAECLRLLAARRPGRWVRWAAPALILAWAGTSAALAGRMRGGWQQFTSGSQAVTSLRAFPPLCGVALSELNFWDTGGYVYLHRPVPLYILDSIDPASRARAYNAIAAPAERASAIPPAYRRLACSSDGRACTWVRDGGCDPTGAEALRIDQVMLRRNW